VGVTQWVCGDKMHSSVLDPTEIKWRNTWIIQHHVSVTLVGKGWTSEIVEKLEPEKHNYPGGDPYYVFSKTFDRKVKFEIMHFKR
jgi:hypothetical protein